MNNFDEEMLLFCKNLKRIKRHSRKWKHKIRDKICKKQQQYFHHLMLEIKMDPVKFANYFRMTDS